MLVLSRADLEKILTPRDVIETMATTFRRYAEGSCQVPSRGGVDTGDGILLVMPAAMGGRAHPALGAKLISVYPGNRARGHSTLYATYVLMDGESGEPLAFLEGTFLTAIRTGATSALAARYLARADARRVVVFGAGVQAGFQLTCLAAVRAIERVIVIGRDPQRARTFADDLHARLGVEIAIADDPRRAVHDTDIVVCATTSRTPVVFGADLRPGAHVDAVGAFQPTDREVDSELVQRARVVVDTYVGALEEAGDLVIPLREGAIHRAHIAAELAELVTGARRGRGRDDEITLFKSVGFALEDLATARLAYDRARALGIGTEVSL